LLEQSAVSQRPQQAVNDHFVHIRRAPELAYPPLLVVGGKHLKKMNSFSDCFHGFRNGVKKTKMSLRIDRPMMTQHCNQLDAPAAGYRQKHMAPSGTVHRKSSL
jgi:hypothetical protein